MEDVKYRLGNVEQNVQTLEEHVPEELDMLKKEVKSQEELCMRFMELFSNLQAQLDVAKVGMEEMRQETAMCKRSIVGEAIVTPSPSGKRQNERSSEARGMPRSSTTSFGTWSDILKVLASPRSKLRMDEDKVKAIKEGKAPTKVSKLRSFLSLVNCYQLFINGYSAGAATLTNPRRKGNARDWSKRCQNAFDGLKDTITKQPVLALPKHAKVHKDASNFAIGGVLMQEGHPIAYENHKLNDIERSDTKLLHSRGCVPAIPGGHGKV
ncbi:hypothetical protein RJ639_044359 [Escallonia herrerae]|uniref:Reverse transcriptase/retrotransposon-derived protein RNase H-like domain-containing protein n=1 Tax=Escallonia herrerae TaxID=1293975 RepID=A0AA88WFD2_9ASTE|nr:hypothetical protein RJ639_044359 [Escallonia herrerae]